MELEKFSEIFVDYLKEINIVLNEEQIEQFYKYMNLLIEWNQKINLTRIINEKDVYLKHKYKKRKACS